MDRKQRLILHPTAVGWKRTSEGADGGAFSSEAASLEAAAGALSPRSPIAISLPSRLVVTERMTLPSHDAVELSAMVRLQFEKVLPHPVEEMVFGWQALRQNGDETSLLACAVHEPKMAALFASWSPFSTVHRIDLWAMHVAAQACAAEPACGVWREGPDMVFGIFQARRLAYLELIRNPLADIPRALISAAMAGAPTRFQRLFLDPSLAEFEEQLSTLVDAPVGEWTASAFEAIPGEAVDLVPEKWRARAAEQAKTRRRWRGLAIAALAYVIFLAGFGVSLTAGQRRLAALEREIAALHPSVDGLIQRQARWNALAPAVDPERFPVELLFQVCQAFPNPAMRLTRFELTEREQLLIEGEAANARQAIAFVENLKKRPALNRYRFESAPPILLSNEHAQFRILAKP